MAEETEGLPPKSDFSAWYNEVIRSAEIMDVRYPVKGLYVWYPFGFALRQHTYTYLRSLLNRDHEECLFPLLIPETSLATEGEHVKGFEDEVYWVTHGGLSPLDVKLALRPTSETAIYPMYSLWVRSHADLPLKLYQVVNTFRYETKHTRPLIRLREITSFMESHTVHTDWDDANKQVEYELGLSLEFYKTLGVPVIISKRPDWDKFPGADFTMAIDAVMPDGRTLQIGTVHHLGSHFSKAFNITYEDINGEQQFASQTCFGISERCIAAVIGVHGDDKGLVLPATVAPTQVVIIPIIVGKRGEEILSAVKVLEEELKGAGLRVKTDTRDMRPGAKYYHWELHGVPLRVELGPRDLDAGQLVCVNRLGVKTTIPRENAAESVARLLQEAHDKILEKAENNLEAHIKNAASVEEANAMLEGNVVAVHWCGDKACADKLEELTNSALLGTEVRSQYITDDEGCCVICGKPGRKAIIGRSY
ncbi:MAG TPA: proline--tRNA ligase [Methanocorpusculum sp.]|nr:proline--tRNA ligase [Candidatus Methanocorpusculum equi]MCQ2357624.1 proline--tRNA ligase [Methanocorpusculum sp.]HJJ32769.1 proline--tRNA ligase [Methanocorpusculum sp.]HJJ44538.1 proline--tRNA ligase [Methanocorpusculum sp.]